jgi:hypothetical protein
VRHLSDVLADWLRLKEPTSERQRRIDEATAQENARPEPSNAILSIGPVSPPTTEDHERR